MKVVINKRHGGFSLSKQAYEFLGIECDGYGYMYDNDRSNPDLVRCVETLKEDSFGRYAQLGVIEIPDDVKWHIEEYDGLEWVAEDHRTWE